METTSRFFCEICREEIKNPTLEKNKLKINGAYLPIYFCEKDIKEMKEKLNIK